MAFPFGMILKKVPYKIRGFGFLAVSGRRYFLSSSYDCNEAWQQRLNDSFLKKFNTEELSRTIQDKFDRHISPTAVDMNIMACKLGEVDTLHLDFIESLFYKFRHTEQCVQASEEMSHALIRGLINLNDNERLMNILKDKVNYGIFLDYYMANILMNKFIKQQQYKDAAAVACDMMLQEDFSHPITRLFAWYSSHLRSQQLLKQSTDIEDTQQQTEETADDDTVYYRRVDYIQNPYYDDHFDIPTEQQLIGKTLVHTTALHDDSLLARSYHLIGWALYQKFDKVLELMSDWLKLNNKDTVSKQAIDLVKTCLDKVKTSEPEAEPKDKSELTLSDLYPRITAQQKDGYLQQFEALSAKLLGSAGVVIDIDLEEELVKNLKNVISKLEQKDISDQNEFFKMWEKRLEEQYEKQQREEQREKKKKDIALRLLQLKVKEERLRFFEKQTEMELLLVNEPEVKKIEEDIDEEQYVPPPSERKDQTKVR